MTNLPKFNKPKQEPFRIVYYPHLNMHIAHFHFFKGVQFARTIKPIRERGFEFKELKENTHYIQRDLTVWIRVMPYDFAHIKRVNIFTMLTHNIKNNIKRLLRHEQASII